VELFETNLDSHQPLAARMRPRNLEEYVGQGHILAPGRLLWRAIQTDRLGSLIFYGPPGTGKTTLAKVIAGHTKSHFASLNAVLSGVKDIREVIEQAKNRRKFQEAKTILFVDEVHRWNKAQQDALLPWVENGTFVLIGATTENPYFEVNSALVSRSRIFQLLPLTEADLKDIAYGALDDSKRGYGQFPITLEPEALDHLIATCEGDARSLLNALELAVEGSGSFPPGPGDRITIDVAAAEESIQRKVVLYDKDGDYHYDTISAFIKSLRGSDPDAALYWLARMVRAGESPRFIFRRMLILASEDVGLADPLAIGVVKPVLRPSTGLVFLRVNFIWRRRPSTWPTPPNPTPPWVTSTPWAPWKKRKLWMFPPTLKTATGTKKPLAMARATSILTLSGITGWGSSTFLPA
jgi:putative ATPase